MTVTIGLIGVGEAGAAIGSGLAEAGASVTGYDADPSVRRRAADSGLTLAGSLADLASGATVIICLTSAKSALPVVRAAAPYLTPDHLYGDWNSAGPAVKRQVAEVVVGTGAGFADGAVMAAVPPYRHRVPVLLSGSGAERLVAVLDGLEMDLTVLGGEPGQASAVKMLRSLLVKGLEALLLECAAGAHAYGVTDHVLGSMPGGLPVHDWRELAAYLMGRSLAHGERRAEELRQVAATLGEYGIEPMLAEAGARRLQWLVDLGVEAGSSYPDALDAIEKARRRT